MPEGDTIFRAARTLARALGGRTVTRFTTQLPALGRIDDEAPIRGRTIEAVRAVGKNLLIEFSGDLVLRTHLRMNGAWHVYKPGERWFRSRMDARIVIETDAYVAVAFAPPVAEFHTRRSVESALRDIGPDLLDSEFDAGEAMRRFRAHDDAEIANALLDQRTLAGIGNVFKSEILFACRVDPFAAVAAIDDETLRKIVDVSQRLLRANVADPVKDPAVSNRGVRRTTGRMDPRAGLWVYGRGGQPCRRCGTPIESKKQGPDVRLTYWCPRCQASSPADL